MKTIALRFSVIVLAAVYPGRDIVCVLLWTDGPRAITLSAARLDAEAPA